VLLDKKGVVGQRTIDRVRRLRGVSWRWRKDVDEHRSGETDMGVIAQEVEAVFPELVTTDEQGLKRVNYVGLIAPLIEAVKELDERLTALESRFHRDSHR
jgi:Chaperone of endosialidase